MASRASWLGFGTTLIATALIVETFVAGQLPPARRPRRSHPPRGPPNDWNKIVQAHDDHKSRAMVTLVQGTWQSSIVLKI